MGGGAFGSVGSSVFGVPTTGGFTFDPAQLDAGLQLPSVSAFGVKGGGPCDPPCFVDANFDCVDSQGFLCMSVTDQDSSGGSDGGGGGPVFVPRGEPEIPDIEGPEIFFPDPPVGGGDDTEFPTTDCGMVFLLNFMACTGDPQGGQFKSRSTDVIKWLLCNDCRVPENCDINGKPGLGWVESCYTNQLFNWIKEPGCKTNRYCEAVNSGNEP